MYVPIAQLLQLQRLHLCRGVRPLPSPNECPVYDTKQSGEALELWGRLSTPSLLLLPNLL